MSGARNDLEQKRKCYAVRRDIQKASRCTSCRVEDTLLYPGFPWSRPMTQVYDFVLQLGFFGIVGIPLFKAMTEVFKDAHPMLDGMLANYKHWEATSASTPRVV